MLSFLQDTVGDSRAEFFLGGYGAFDDFAYRCCKKYQAAHPNTKLVFITPYLSQEKELMEKAAQYDAVIYPEIENAPKRYAISYRNRWMVQKADLVIAYVTIHLAVHIKHITVQSAQAKQFSILLIAHKSFLVFAWPTHKSSIVAGVGRLINNA